MITDRISQPVRPDGIKFTTVNSFVTLILLLLKGDAGATLRPQAVLLNLGACTHSRPGHSALPGQQLCYVCYVMLCYKCYVQMLCKGRAEPELTECLDTGNYLHVIRIAVTHSSPHKSYNYPIMTLTDGTRRYVFLMFDGDLCITVTPGCEGHLP